MRVVYGKIRANNDNSRKPVIVQISTSGRKGIPEDVQVIETEGDRTPDVLQPVKIDSRVCIIKTIFSNLSFLKLTFQWTKHCHLSNSFHAKH